MKIITEYIATAIAVAAIVVIVYGTLAALVEFVVSRIKRDKTAMRHIRVDFGGYLLLGLELLIGADIIRTILGPSYEELIILGGTVVIRTIFSVFLNKEIQDLEK